MNSLQIIEKQFDAIGARLMIHKRLPNPRSANIYDLNIRRDRHGEHYALGVPPVLPNFKILQTDRATRHLLMMADADRLLCGHDERHWFVAAIDQQVSTVIGAKRALLPRELSEISIAPSVLARRHNAVFLRQGEWFFVPVSADRAASLNGWPILHNEPLVRNRRSKPHMVSDVVRFGGQRVVLYAGKEYSVEEWLKYHADHPHARGNEMMKNPEVYARGHVRHPDHATLTLRDWHRVYPNREASSINVSFYD